jgi:LysM repeat protein
VGREDWRRYAAPAAFLIAVTIAVVLIRSGINHGKTKTPAATAPVTTHSATTTTRSQPPKKKKKKKPSTRRYYTVQAGDTFNVISSKTGVPVATIARLNPKASSTSLFIGEKIRIR